MTPELMTFREALEALRIGKTKLTAMMKAREIPYVKMGKRVFFRRVDLDRFIESRLVKPE